MENKDYQRLNKFKSLGRFASKKVDPNRYVQIESRSALDFQKERLERLKSLANVSKKEKQRFGLALNYSDWKEDLQMFLFVLLIFGILVYAGQGALVKNITSFFSKKGEISAITATSDAYTDWSMNNYGKMLTLSGDEDSDGLSNQEEYILGSNALNPNTCSKESSDGENLTNLIDPVSCLKMDLNDPQTLEKYSRVAQLSSVQNQIQKLEVLPTGTVEKPNPITGIVSGSSLVDTFGVKNYQDLDKLKPEDISKQLNTQNELAKRQIEDLKKIQKVSVFINKNRSYSAFDRNYDLPVHPAIFLDVSKKYNVPLKYVLAMAWSESNFGTNRFNNDGTLNRIGTYKNMYAIGLTQSTSSGFETWEKGVEAFGKWYSFYQKKGLSDCQKWRVYNPNGDYCASIEAKANKVSESLS